MAEAKHAFVDDNPYLVYSPKAEITYDGNSDGGGIGFPVIESAYDEKTYTTSLEITASELAALIDVSPVMIMQDPNETFNANWEIMTAYKYDVVHGYVFHSFLIIQDDVFIVSTLLYNAENGNSKPILD